MKIALVGKKKAGRTFIAQYLKNKYKYKKWALNDGVSRIYKLLYDWHNWEQVPWETKMEVYDFFYAKDNDVWVKFLSRRLEKTESNIVIDDVRYINEVKYLQKLGFIIIRVTAPEDRRIPHISKQLGPRASTGTVVLNEYFNVDKTESYQVDYSIHNITRDDTRLAVDNLIKNLTNKE